MESAGRYDRARLELAIRHGFSIVYSWGDERGIQPSELGVRITYFGPPPRTEESVPDCDFAVPFH